MMAREMAFAELVQQLADALVVSSAISRLYRSPIKSSRWRPAMPVPAIYALRTSRAVGGLIGYWTNYLDAWRQGGVYTGRSSRAKTLPICRSYSRPSLQRQAAPGG
jgi:hypothetical protein